MYTKLLNLVALGNEETMYYIDRVFVTVSAIKIKKLS